MKVIITDCDHDNIEIETKVLTEAGIEFELKCARTEDEVIEQCKGADIFIVQYANISERVMEALPELKYVVRYGVGVDTVDVEAAVQHGVQVGNVPDYGMNEVADHALAMMLMMVRKVHIMNRFTKSCGWDYTRAIPVRRLSEQTAGVVGMGRIGRNFAKKASALGFRVIGYDPQLSQGDRIGETEIVSFEELVSQSDAISLHCPADGNKDLFNLEVFQQMKNSAVIINAARGGIINEEDLDQALREKMISGAALDCMSAEPVSPDSSIFENENLIVTPHMAWYSEEAAEELKRKAAEEAVRFAQGEPIRYPVNRMEGGRYYE
ncbi:C-terminal binding protein [Anaerostipes sp.]|uniref:C-terminal binding protein n=1 Tax=Anaerostipes sp. TaxID=1872530 RepID=UPI0025BE7D7B|nr:C-terminal binding protein [Anaerostipes sp.]MBS7006844.1 C-terminal binding protein [Anaerostipes sp.]